MEGKFSCTQKSHFFAVKWKKSVFGVWRKVTLSPISVWSQPRGLIFLIFLPAFVIVSCILRQGKRGLKKHLFVWGCTKSVMALRTMYLSRKSVTRESSARGKFSSYFLSLPTTDSTLHKRQNNFGVLNRKNGSLMVKNDDFDEKRAKTLQSTYKCVALQLGVLHINCIQDVNVL